MKLSPFNTGAKLRQYSIRKVDTAFARSALETAKARLPISAAWRALGLPGVPPSTGSGVVRSPLREDRRASFSVTRDELWHDLATGEGGDVVSLVRAATGCTPGEAVRRVLSLAEGSAPAFALAHRQGSARPAPAPFDGLAGLDLRAPCIGELVAIAEARAWPVFAGLELAARRGLLRVADVPHRGHRHPAWILTDSARRSAQARRLDGQPWTGGEGSEGFKSKSLRSDADHPPGLADALEHSRPVVLLAEGEPDALAALSFAWLAGIDDRVGVIALTGTAKACPPSLCASLAGRRVRIFRQNDAPAAKACAAWASSLEASGVACDVQPLDGLRRADAEPAKDLADLLRRPAELEHLEPLAAALLRGL